jgi:hypothetical protein
VGDIDFEVISAAENSNKSKKPGFERKNQLRTWSHLKALNEVEPLNSVILSLDL